MSRNRGQISRTSNEPLATSVDIAFSNNRSPHHCGYCNQNGSITIGINSSNMLVDDYQSLMDRGWRKCGTYFYKALMQETCCPLYTIRCDVNNFQLSRSQRRVVQAMNLFINENKKPENQTQRSSNMKSTVKQSISANELNLEQWMKTEQPTNAIQILQHVLTNDTPLSDELLKRLRARQKRWYKKLLKLKIQNKLSMKTDVHLLIKRFNRMKRRVDDSLENILKFNENPINNFETRLLRSYPLSNELRDTLQQSHSIYERYQMAVHHDEKYECSFAQYQRFLCKSSLESDSPRIHPSNVPSCGYGSFHLQYYLNKRLIACSVIDILPLGISSVYFYYDPEFSFLKLGVYSALKEIELTRKLSREIPDLKYYYLGYYIHTCTKMRYKGQYKPSYLLCPETYTWHPIEKCIPLLNSHKYARFESNPSIVDSDQENTINNLKLRVGSRIISPSQLQALDERYFMYFREIFVTFANCVGQTCAHRLIIDLN